MNSNPFAHTMRVILSLGLFLAYPPAGTHAQEAGTGYDSEGNYIEDVIIDDNQNRKLDLKRLQQKQEEYIKKIKKDPKNFLNYFYLGNVYLELNRPEEAIAVYEETVKLNPKNGKAHYHLAKAYDRINDSSQAIKHIGIASRIFRDNFDLHWQTKAKNFLMQLRDRE